MGRDMKICVRKLTTCGISEDGEILDLRLLHSSDEVISVHVPFDQAASLVMTLPQLLARALKRRTGLERSRYVFHLAIGLSRAPRRTLASYLPWRPSMASKRPLQFP